MINQRWEIQITPSHNVKPATQSENGDRISLVKRFKWRYRQYQKLIHLSKENHLVPELPSFVSGDGVSNNVWKKYWEEKQQDNWVSESFHSYRFCVLCYAMYRGFVRLQRIFTTSCFIWVGFLCFLALLCLNSLVHCTCLSYFGNVTRSAKELSIVFILFF